MGNGRKGIAPCGHEGEAVIGQYYECLQGCQGNIDLEEPTLEILICVNCGSLDIDEEFQLDPLFYFFNPSATILDIRCNNCGHCWTRS